MAFWSDDMYGGGGGMKRFGRNARDMRAQIPARQMGMNDSVSNYGVVPDYSSANAMYEDAPEMNGRGPFRMDGPAQEEPPPREPEFQRDVPGYDQFMPPRRESRRQEPRMQQTMRAPQRRPAPQQRPMQNMRGSFSQPAPQMSNMRGAAPAPSPAPAPKPAPQGRWSAFGGGGY